MVERLNIPYSQFQDGRYPWDVQKKIKKSSQLEEIFVTDVQGHSLDDVLSGIYTIYSPLNKNTDLIKALRDINKNNSGKYQIASDEYGPQNGNLSRTYFAIGDRLFNHNGSEYDWKKDESDRFDKANGKIDNPFYQAHEGDCWLLSSVLKDKDFIDKNKVMQKQADGSWAVTVANPLNPVKIHNINVSRDDFTSIENLNLSGGDPDVKIMEIATKKLYKKLGINNGSIEGNNSYNAITMIEKKPANNVYYDPLQSLKTNKKNALKALDKLAETKEMATAGTGNEEFKSFTGKTLYKDPNAEFAEPKFYPEHAYTITKVDSKRQIVEFVNPRNSSKTFTATYDEFLDNVHVISM